VKDVAEPDEVLQIDRFVQAELLVEDRLGFGVAPKPRMTWPDYRAVSGSGRSFRPNMTKTMPTSSISRFVKYLSTFPW